MSAPVFHAYVGCRTTRERNARGEGLEVFAVDAGSGWTHIQRVPDLVNPSFLAFDSRRRFLYVVHGDGSDVSAFAIGADGQVAFVDAVSAKGKNPVHLALSTDDRFLIVANHLSSAVAVLQLDPTSGRFAGGPMLYPLEGEPGPHRTEQPFAKPHGVTFTHHGRFLLVPDKGVDRVFVFRFDAATGRLAPTEQGAARAREGAGPRHAVVHPGGRFAYALNELDSTVTAYRLEPESGALEPLQIVPALPDSFTGNSRAAELAMTADGRFLYASNRGHDSVAAFVADAATGRLSVIGWVPSGGRTPRFIGLDPADRSLYVANEEDDTIKRYRRDPATGLLHDPMLAALTGSPTCILFRQVIAR